MIEAHGTDIGADEVSLIPAEVSLPEITFKSVILAIVITAVLGAANAYLALKLGQTISASIPAAIIAMGHCAFLKDIMFWKIISCKPPPPRVRELPVRLRLCCQRC